MFLENDDKVSKNKKDKVKSLALKAKVIRDESSDDNIIKMIVVRAEKVKSSLGYYLIICNSYGTILCCLLYW